jgi:endonuclease-3 related protein
MRDTEQRELLQEIYDRLYKYFGPQRWWPADSPLEVILGAILTQNTSWKNVEKAIGVLKKEGLISPSKLKYLTELKLARMIRSCGYPNLKAKRIKNFINFLFQRYRGKIRNMFSQDYLKLRAELLKINGLGLETVDSILLYAGEKPIFVIDNYTKRILQRHNIIDKHATYTQIQNLFMDNLPEDAKLFNEYHALLVRLGKEICRLNPRCDICPLKDIDNFLEYRCDSCGELLKDSYYISEIKLYASPQIVLKGDDFKDIDKKIKTLIEELKRKDIKRLEKEIFSIYRFRLCKRCRDKFWLRLEMKELV